MLRRGGGTRVPRPLYVRSMRLTLASVGQPGTASGAATSQNLAPVGSGHALAEPVLLGTLTLLGLIGTNHSDTPPVSISSGKPRQPQRLHCPSRGCPIHGNQTPKGHDYVKLIITEKNPICQPKFLRFLHNATSCALSFFTLRQLAQPCSSPPRPPALCPQKGPAPSLPTRQPSPGIVPKSCKLGQNLI